MAEKYYKVPSETLAKLLFDSRLVDALESAGVNNWDGHGELDWEGIEHDVEYDLNGFEEIKND